MIRDPSFTEILDGLAQSDDSNIRVRSRGFPGLSGQDWLFAVLDEEAPANPARPDCEAAFFSDMEDSEFEQQSFEVDEDQIAAELGLAAVISAADLARARRVFAAHNHPDIVAPAFRSQANERMQIANMLLDRRACEIKAKR
jgi:hypothetical protein